MDKRPPRSLFGSRRDWSSDYIPQRRTLGGEIPDQPRWMVRALYLTAIVLLVLAVLGVYLKFRPLPFSPDVWKSSGGFTRGRMLSSLLEQTDFVGFTRPEVEHYLGAPDYDERQFWYDLGVDTTDQPLNTRAQIGDAERLYGVFNYRESGTIAEVQFSRRRPILGSEPFDSTGWFSGNPDMRRTMFTNSLGRLRVLGLTYANVHDLLGPPDGSRIRAQYDVGIGGAFMGGLKALILQYDDSDVVISSQVTE